MRCRNQGRVWPCDAPRRKQDPLIGLSKHLPLQHEFAVVPYPRTARTAVPCEHSMGLWPKLCFDKRSDPDQIADFQQRPVFLISARLILKVAGLLGVSDWSLAWTAPLILLGESRV